MGLGLRTRHCTNKSALIGSVVAVALVCFAPSVSEAQTVAGGLKHTLVVKPDGTVWSFGDNFDGELGDTTNTDRTTPVMVSGLTDIVAVAAGQSHSMALSSSGVLWTWGDNYYGELGDGSGVDQLAPVQVPSLSGVSAIAAGQFHSVALLANGDVYVWGRNDSGQFGNGTTGIVNANPTLVATDAIAIGAGVSHTLIVKTDGSVWAAGANAYGQLGIGSTGSYVTTFTAMTGVAGAVKAVGGGRHSLIQLADGTVKAVGFNGYGQLGDGMPNDRLVAAAVSGLTDVTTVTAGYDRA